jgi:hypothetical protein
VEWSRLHSYHSCVRGVSMGYTQDSRGWIPGRDKAFLFSTTSRPVLGPTQPLIQWVLGALFLGVKRSGREAEINGYSYHSCVRGVSVGHRLDSRGWILGRGKLFFYSTTSRQVLVASQPPIQWVPGALSSPVKTFANYYFFYTMPLLLSRVASFLTESWTMPGISASKHI